MRILLKSSKFSWNFYLSQSEKTLTSASIAVLTAVVLLQHQFCCTVDTGIIAQCCQCKFCIFAGWKCIFFVIFLDIIKEYLSGFGDAAADYKYLRIYHTCDVCTCKTEVSAEFFCDFLCNCIARFYGIKDAFCTDFSVTQNGRGIAGCQLFVCQIYNTCCRCNLFQTSGVATVARFVNAVGYMDMSDLTAGSLLPVTILPLMMMPPPTPVPSVTITTL